MEKQIIYRELAKEETELCRGLCNELMAHQAARGKKYPEILAAMNYDNRLDPTAAAAQKGKLLAAFDGEEPVGYLFAEVATVTEEARDNSRPERYLKAMAPQDAAGEGFFPSWLECPVTIGEIGNLYVKPEYRGLGIAKTLMDRGMAWLEADPAVKDIYVYVSNGNDAADFYARYGFRFNHEVMGGFITCYRKAVR